MARHFMKVSEEEIVAINEAAFFYPSDLVNTKTTIPPMFLRARSETDSYFPLKKNLTHKVRI